MVRDSVGKLVKILIDPHGETDKILQARGLPLDVDIVVVSHCHPDHMEGLLSGAFRGAKIITQGGLIRESLENILDAASKLNIEDLRDYISFHDDSEARYHGLDKNKVVLPGDIEISFQKVDHFVPTSAIKIAGPRTSGNPTFVYAPDFQNAEKDKDLMKFMFKKASDQMADRIWLDGKTENPVHQDLEKLIPEAVKLFKNDGVSKEDIKKQLFERIGIIHYSDRKIIDKAVAEHEALRVEDGSRYRLKVLEVGDNVKVGKFTETNGSEPVVSIILSNLYELGVLSEDDFNKVNKLLKGYKNGERSIETVSKGTVMISQGTYIENAYLIRSGSVRIIDQLTGKILAVRGAGEIIGESILLGSDILTNATAISTTDVEYTRLMPGDLPKAAEDALKKAWKYRKYIKQSDIFRYLPSSIHTLIAAIVEENEYGPSENSIEVIKEGQKGDRAYIIARGNIEVIQNIGGTEKFIDKRKEGEHIGEMALYEHDYRRNATCRIPAGEKALLLSLLKEKFDFICKRYQCSYETSFICSELSFTFISIILSDILY
ncbi:cyclic nucleotide-binding domain-containing protein [Elusimicrobiota bacterium]